MKLRILLVTLLVCAFTQKIEAVGACSLSATTAQSQSPSITYKVSISGITYISTETAYWLTSCFSTFKTTPGPYQTIPSSATATGGWGVNPNNLQPVPCNPLFHLYPIPGGSNSLPPGVTIYADSWGGSAPSLGEQPQPGCLITAETVQHIDCAPSCPQSPIIFDLNGQGFHCTSAQGGVQFDITGDGNPVQIGWTAIGADNAFLALPGPDGLVHNGTQLFGNYTPQPPSDDPNGFLALAVYDTPAKGGNGDGVIDSRDAIWPSLRLWIDTNHDGISQPNELHTLDSLGVHSLSLKYTESLKTDEYGNIFRYTSTVNPGLPPDGVDRRDYDVFLVLAF